MKRKAVRSAKTVKSATSSRRPARRSPAKARASAPARRAAQRKAAKKKTVRRAARARKAAPVLRKRKPVAMPAAPVTAQTMAAEAKEPAVRSTTVAGPAREALAALPTQPPAALGPARPRPSPPPGQPALPIPPILLEGDERTLPVAPGPVEKYVLGPMPPAAPPSAGAGELPEAYGTGKLFLTARDPHCLYAHWDFTEAQQRRYGAFAHHLALRVYRDNLAGQPVAEDQVHAESRHAFVRVDRAGSSYVAQLGAYQPGGEWVSLATSEPAATPPEAVAEDRTVRWAVVQPFIPAPQPPTLQPEAAAPAPAAAPPPSAPQFAAPFVPAPVVRPGQAEPAWALPTPEYRAPAPAAVAAQPVHAAPAPIAVPPELTPAQERVLAEMIETALVQQRTIGSLEAVELSRRQLWREVIVPAAQAGASLPPGLPLPLGGPASLPVPVEEQALGISSAPGAPPGVARQFWFNLNVEVVVYGATEPDARVTLAGRPVRLRPDGTFSCRFALPDGCYDLPAVAVSTDNDLRRAEVTLGRRTQYQGEVGVHPQDKALRPPTPENIPAAQTT